MNKLKGLQVPNILDWFSGYYRNIYEDNGEYILNAYSEICMGKRLYIEGMLAEADTVRDMLAQYVAVETAGGTAEFK